MKFLTGFAFGVTATCVAVIALSVVVWKAVTVVERNKDSEDKDTNHVVIKLSREEYELFRDAIDEADVY